MGTQDKAQTQEREGRLHRKVKLQNGKKLFNLQGKGAKKETGEPVLGKPVKKVENPFS